MNNDISHYFLPALKPTTTVKVAAGFKGEKAAQGVSKIRGAMFAEKFAPGIRWVELE